MRRIALIAVLTILAFPLIASSDSDDKAWITGLGAFPISKTTTSMWLASQDRRPLLMVYFHGPEGWHDTQWKINSKFEKGKPAWAELKSEKVTLRLSLNPESGEAEVQSGKFKVTESNTFLVLLTGGPAMSEKIVPLGIFDLPPSKDHPASVLLLQSKPDLAERIEALVHDRQPASQTNR